MPKFSSGVKLTVSLIACTLLCTGFVNCQKSTDASEASVATNGNGTGYQGTTPALITTCTDAQGDRVAVEAIAPDGNQDVADLNLHIANRVDSVPSRLAFAGTSSVYSGQIASPESVLLTVDNQNGGSLTYSLYLNGATTLTSVTAPVTCVRPAATAN